MNCLLTIAVLLFSSLCLAGQDQSVLVSKIDFDALIKAGDEAKNIGQLADAEKKYNAACVIAEKLLDEGASERNQLTGGTLFDGYDRLGYLHLASNNSKRAEYYFKLSQARREARLPRRSVFRADPYVGLAEVAIRQHENEKGIMLLQEAERILFKASTTWVSTESLSKKILFNKAELLFREKAYRNLWKVLEKLSSGGFISFQSSKEATAQIPEVFEMKARYYLETGDIKNARIFLKKASVYSEALKTNLLQFRIVRTEALMQWSQNNIVQAANLLLTLTESYKKFVVANFTSMSEHEKENFFLLLREDFDLFNAFVLANIQDPNVSFLFDHAYDNQIFSKALLLNESNKLRVYVENSADEQLKNIYADWDESKSKLASLYFNNKQKENEIESLEAKIENLERELNLKTSLFSAYKEDTHWQQIQQKLEKEDCAIEIIRVPQFSMQGTNRFRFSDSSSYLILSVSSASIRPSAFVISDGNRMETRSLTYYRNCIQANVDDTLSYSNFWLPIKRQISFSGKIFLSSDGVYNQINVATLRNPNTKNYQLSEEDIVLVTNTRDLLSETSPPSERIAGLYGSPAFRQDEQQMNTHPSTSGLVSRALDNDSFDDFRNQSFTDLPGSMNEINKLAQLFAQQNVKVNYHSGHDASETNLRMEKASILHIATHGFFLNQQPGFEINAMIRSGIILAGVNNTQSNAWDDGIVTAYEATTLNLQGTELVVLSACETGLGETRNGIGVYGLQRGLTVAGAQHLLMSLWKVDDTATDLLMQKFYTGWLSGIEIHEAFKLAQVELAKTYPYPFYWGAFILIGK